LREFLASEQPHLLDEFDDYAAAVARGETVPVDLPPLEAIALEESDLAPGDVSRWLTGGQPLSLELLRLLLRADQPSTSAIDTVLTGGNVTAASGRLYKFETTLARELSALESRRTEIARQRADVESRIHTIENANHPVRPSEPSIRPDSSYDQR